MMGKATISIPLVTLRPVEGGGFRPRYIPGNRHRKLGLKGEDLRHPDGRWFTLDECAAWSIAKLKEIDALAAADTPRARRAIVHRAAGITVGELFAKWFQDPRMKGKALIEGKKERAPLSKATVDYYKMAARPLEKLDDGLFWNSPAAAVTTRILDAAPVAGKTKGGVLHRIEVEHDLAMTRAARASLSACYSWGLRNNLVPSNPVKGVALPTLPPRVRYGSVEEMRQLVRAADLIELPEIGDSIMLGLWTGQRQETRLNLTEAQRTKDGTVFRQSKKHGQPLLIPEAPDLGARLEAARERRRDWKVAYSHVVLDERARKPFSGRSWYGVLFRRVRDAAVKGIVRDGVTILRPMPSLEDFRDQDLRDTAVTWLALAGVDKFGISSITGHTLASIDQILSHYLGLHPELAKTAIAKLVAWSNQQGETNG